MKRDNSLENHLKETLYFAISTDILDSASVDIAKRRLQMIFSTSILLSLLVIIDVFRGVSYSFHIVLVVV